MEDRKIPEPAFNPPATREAPRRLPEVPNRDATLNTFNGVFARFETAGRALETRRQQGGFAGLEAAAQKIKANQPLDPGETQLIIDYTTYLDYRNARGGRDDLNAADYVNGLEARQRGGLT